jgi:hypothetical protein
MTEYTMIVEGAVRISRPMFPIFPDAWAQLDPLKNLRN